jgi:hypothetical protein
MNWFALLKATITSGLVVSMTDWYFFGILFHNRYHEHPGVWRKYKDKKDEMRSISKGCVLSVLTCIGYFVLCDWLNVRGFSSALIVALIIWFIGPFLQIISNVIFMNFGKPIAVSHSLGWIVRFVVAAGVYSLFF